MIAPASVTGISTAEPGCLTISASSRSPRGSVIDSTLTVKTRPWKTRRISCGTIGLFIVVPLRKILEHAHQVSWQRYGELHSPLVPWMFEGKALGVQERPLEAQNGTKISGHPTPHAAIHCVAND